MLTLHIGTNRAREGGSYDQPAVTCFFTIFFGVGEGVERGIQRVALAIVIPAVY